MSTAALLGIALASVVLLLVLIIRFQVHAFVAMMLVSILVALVAGMPTADIVPTLIQGMGGTLGSVAILVALGAMLGRIIEVSGGAGSLAHRFTGWLGPKRVPAALTAAALVLSIPVFFDVGFIILVPIIYGFCKAAKVDPVKFGLPVAGIMLATHVVVPPHPARRRPPGPSGCPPTPRSPGFALAASRAASRCRCRRSTSSRTAPTSATAPRAARR